MLLVYSIRWCSLPTSMMHGCGASGLQEWWLVMVSCWRSVVLFFFTSTFHEMNVLFIAKDHDGNVLATATQHSIQVLNPKVVEAESPMEYAAGWLLDRNDGMVEVDICLRFEI
ncbi:hypothetical protein E2542_SST24236 [Spatholobus suberectus]|nr:hypothetical protein E2542_SST24236 [Spatholobus suberectus]